MDKGWMCEPKFSKRYVEGVKSFMKFVQSRFDQITKVRCPCQDCLNINFQTQEVVYDELLMKGIMKDYVQWIYHGEQPQKRDNGEVIYEEDENEEHDNDDAIQTMLEEASGRSFANFSEEKTTGDNVFGNMSEKEAKKFDTLLEEAERELYPGCKKFSKLLFLVKLLHLKVYNQWSNKSFTMLLELLKEALPNGETLPKSYYDAKSMLQGLGLGYISIHACTNDCVLYWAEHKDRQKSPHCGTSRWKIDNGRDKKIPHKVLRYFPLKPRLQRLFMSKKISEDLRWHKEKHLDEANVLRHPADSEAWKEFDMNHQWFAQEPRNIRLGLATDGFNPFGNMSTSYSMWPVILAPYNLPPWKCFKDPFMIMSLLIPGPQAPGKDIDVYLRPLIDELKELWNDGVETFDTSTGECFKMHAAVLWTINDFPAYGNLSGWSTKGYMACPTCNKDAPSRKIRSKICYTGHHRYLEPSHSWRRSRKFDGKKEERLKPKELSGDDILQQLDLLSTYRPGKQSNSKKNKCLPEELNWVRRSILFELPYWKSLKLRHNLDFMHIEKNICESILGTLLDIDGKTKDTDKARKDLKDMNIRKELWLKQDGSNYTMPAACYNMTKKEKKEFWAFLKSVKFLDGYASNISGCVSVDDAKINRLKSHDYHVWLQRLLPVALRGFVNKNVSSAVIELGQFFQRLCCKTLRRDDLEQLERDIIIILCKLEMIFPPAFFDVMVHLAVHLPREAMYGGPVQYRWMYKIERFLCKLKRYVRNKARPEGSIAEGYIIDECLTFCSMYLTGIETRFNREDRNDDGSSNKDELILDIFSKSVRPFKEGNYYEIPKKDFDMDRWYVLNNCEEAQPFLQEHKEESVKQAIVNIEEKHREQFPLWFKRKIMQLYNKQKSLSIKKLFPLAMEPDWHGYTYFTLMIRSWGRIGELCKNFKIDTYMKCQRCKIQKWKVMNCILLMMKCIKMCLLKVIRLVMILRICRVNYIEMMLI
ncbi:uncharacterized protein LOC132623787 isoform X2 [Lycium barbarum]|uniref:uncharacterized protein LOC132623787 isoform X2 n=1 Tax=Lycium barbarum TaxID=112863 RepID=UPI00293EFA48|nr:uncharacterized protein LOC132623787 isoform X2 [Lycium barbarum]